MNIFGTAAAGQKGTLGVESETPFVPRLSLLLRGGALTAVVKRHWASDGFLSTTEPYEGTETARKETLNQHLERRQNI